MGIRKYYLDLLRVLAVFLVLLNHCLLFECYMTSSGLAQFIFFIISSFISINVPLFLMISGSLLLGKQESWSQVIKNRVFRFVVVLVIIQFSLQFAYWLSSIFGGGTYNFSFLDFIKGLISGKLNGAISYWFLYGYIGFLLFSPFLKAFVKEMRLQDFKIIFVFYFAVNVIFPIVKVVVQNFLEFDLVINQYLLIPVVSTRTLFYPIVGYYLDTKVDLSKIRHKTYIHLHLFAFLMIFISYICLLLENHIDGNYSQLFVRMNEMLLSFIVFLDIKTIMFKKSLSDRTKQVLTSFSDVCFGIYLLDPILLVLLSFRFKLVLGTIFSPLLISLLWCVFSFLVNGAVVYLLKKNKIFRILI